MPSEPGLRLPAPTKPLTLDEVAERYPRLRQSFLGSFDECALSALFDLRHAAGVTTSPQARGTMFHRVAAEVLRECQRTDSETCPVDVGLAILEECLRQRNVPPAEIVRVPFRELRDLEWTVRKFCFDNAWSVRNILGIERRLEAPVTYRDTEGELRSRLITGQLDVLMVEPPNGAAIIDFKDTWSLPPLKDPEDPNPGIAGYFQQQVYSYLVLSTFPTVEWVETREFYPRRTEVRAARLHRADLPDVARRLSVLVETADRALASGSPANLKMETLEAHGLWKPSPGYHCRWCPKAHHCPIDADYRGDGGLRTAEAAAEAAGARQQAKAVDKKLTPVLKAYVDVHGPIPIKRSKGRMVLGYRRVKNGVRFEEYAPEEADRPSTEFAYDPNSEARLVAAMKESTERAREARIASA